MAGVRAYSFLLVCLKTSTHGIALAGLEFTMKTKLSLNSETCLSLLGSRRVPPYPASSWHLDIRELNPEMTKKEPLRKVGNSKELYFIAFYY